ncbi:uncharacterized protein LOC123675485 [Harmonia axyridis]|uniref:uncharacterized protein LOC123675485 n=1 Tax=Harmonia axyridis TaxID=115357 RepID=UPI001E278C5A|nr:uncharacterized protein LOC123675485 [Harmonia axyridis]
MPNPSAAAPTPGILARLQIPAFTPEDPEVVKSLDGRYAKEVRDLIINPPAQKPYETLKEQLLQRLGKSQAQKTRQLLERVEIGDRKPSQFLRYLQQLAGDNAADEIVRALWMERINPLARASIAAQAAQPNVTLDDLAKTADCVMEALGTVAPQQVSAVSPRVSQSESQLCEVLERLSMRLDEQSRELNELRAEVRGRSRNYGGPTSGRRSRSGSRTRFGGRCFYHHRFGAKAHKCEKPCTYAGTDDDQGNGKGSR